MHPLSVEDPAVVAPVTAPPDPVPDLLEATPTTRLDLATTRLAVSLAFASGVASGLVADALDRAGAPRSSWEPGAFTEDLFLPSFVARAFRVHVGGEHRTPSTKHLLGVLSHPPDDAATREHRRGILAELVSSHPLRAALEHLYLALSRFRGLLEGSASERRWDANRRQLDVLAAIKAIVDATATDFAAAQSGLARLAGFGRRVQAGEPYAALRDLLAYDEQLATVNVNLRVGADGRVRGFEITAIREARANPFASGPVRRWLARFELFLRGYRFGDAEIMARLLDAVFEGIQDEVVRLVQLVGDVEVYLGALGFHDLAREAGLDVCLPSFVTPDEPRVLEGLFNPHLLTHGVHPVPCDVHIDRHDATVLVTGPNSGGKTRLLQSIGLAHLLAQSGMFVPARSAKVALAQGLVVSLRQETQADQSEGRLGMELVRIRALFEQLPPGAVVLLDELCSGTNPSEGEEIFELVVKTLTRLRPSAFITTHFLAFAARLQREAAIPGLRFLQVALGPDARPTYQFIPGVAATSLAGEAARRLGVTAEQLQALVERNLRAAGKHPAAGGE